ncbi:hypothetical protein BDW02DRAFT_410204 [Decorospora gaudefroyi]|uniref:Uncharacterized protein n=1 Tax=Decorospora gaudefroyi TaxID=184978 RepID=A0A6A5K526_9PLEO|nr:hypothetical protein BDW02DRAFT_410204 [Decorospora gaudefroyi]
MSCRPFTSVRGMTSRDQRFSMRPPPRPGLGLVVRCSATTTTEYQSPATRRCAGPSSTRRVCLSGARPRPDEIHVSSPPSLLRPYTSPYPEVAPASSRRPPDAAPTRRATLPQGLPAIGIALSTHPPCTLPATLPPHRLPMIARP